MVETQKPTSSVKSCPVCGAELGEVQFCPKCLLEAGFRTQPAERIRPRGSSKGFPQAGDDFGHYRLVRLLGRGGMGSVYEADDLETGRRIALKLLDHSLDSPEARQRFLQEGLIAASINHPNSVYVYGATEIAGTPVISMELLAGGTLQQRMRDSGALPHEEAVDCVMQIISGLEAAQRAGILHRDVKPSNCFIDSEGRIKVGDFGLSISTHPHSDLGLSPDAFLGTPGFSSPEQIAGGKLTVQSDIYSVGATLYYLLTGHRALDSESVTELLALTREAQPEPLERWRPGIPRGLGRVVLRCLAKEPTARFADYAKLREALLPYTSTAPTHATLALRFLAGALDISMLGLIAEAVQFGLRAEWTAFYPLLLVYFGVLEGIWGASLGKLLFRLQVVRTNGNPPGVWRAIFRVLVFAGLSLFAVDLVGLFFAGKDSRVSDTLQGMLATALLFIFLALLFVKARKGNGYAALHDWLSKTRVFSRKYLVNRNDARPQTNGLSFSGHKSGGRAVPAPKVGAEAASSGLGRYQLLAPVRNCVGGEIWLGHDPQLQRKVWLRKLAPHAPDVPPALRNLSRPGRLRWLGGQRSDNETWDAYEELTGLPLIDLLNQELQWSALRFWMFELAEEMHAAARDGSMQDLSLDRVWITADGHAKLLDFSIADASATIPAREFLWVVACSALAGRAVSAAETAIAALPALPIPARTLLDDMKLGLSAGEVARRLVPMLGQPAYVSRSRRLALFLVALWFPLFLTATVRMLSPASMPRVWNLGVLAWLYGIGVVMIPSLLATLLFRGGALLRGFGLEVVTGSGARASRARILWRNALAYLPFLVFPAIAAASMRLDADDLSRSCWLIAIPFLLTVLSLLLPKRSLQDRLAGTSLVPK